MKKTLIVALMALAVTGASAKTAKDSTNSNKPVFTVIKELPVTSMKDQNKSGTCWAYSTLSFFESEILKNSGKTYDLSEMFVANKTYMDRATKAVRMHGDVSFLFQRILRVWHTFQHLRRGGLKVTRLDFRFQIASQSFFGVSLVFFAGNLHLRCTD